LRYKGLFSNRHLVADRRLSDYFELRLQELELSAFCRLVGLVLAQVATVGDKLRNLAVDFNRLIEQFSVPPALADESTDRNQSLQRIATARIAAGKTELLVSMERALEENLRQVATTDARDARSKLAADLRRTSRMLILDVLKQFAMQETAAALEGRPHEPQFAVATGLTEALPQRLAFCGGQRRLLIVAPDVLAPAMKAPATADGKSMMPTVLADAGGDVLICYEVEDQPLRRIAGKVLDKRYQAVGVAGRLHTRSDVPWTPL
jgi:hypothetical protein